MSYTVIYVTTPAPITQAVQTMVEIEEFHKDIWEYKEIQIKAKLLNLLRKEFKNAQYTKRSLFTGWNIVEHILILGPFSNMEVLGSPRKS